MKIYRIVLLMAVFVSAFPWSSSVQASEAENCQPDGCLSDNCKSFTEKELGSIKAKNEPILPMGIGIITLACNPTSSIGKDLLESASRIESSKGIATITLVNYNLDTLAPLKENISKLLQDDKNNALSYYFSALLLREAHADQEALDQIKKGNTYKFNGYSKQRFRAIAQVAEVYQCGVRQSLELAFLNSNSGAIYLKLRFMCRDLNKELGQNAQDACMAMGKNLEASSLTCLESLFSLHMQSESLNQTASDEATRGEIKKRRDIAFACGARTVDVQESDMTDEIVKQYYEIYLNQGEAAAQKFLNEVLTQRHKETNKPVHNDAPKSGA